MYNQEFITYLQEHGKSKNTIRRYDTIIGSFLEWYESSNGVNPLENISFISPLDMQDWKQFLLTTYRTKQGKKLSVSSVNNYIEGIRSFFRFLTDEKGVITQNPVRVLKGQKIKTGTQPRWLTRQEKKQMLFYLKDERFKEKNEWRYYRNLSIIYSMIHCGLRKSEVMTLELDDIDRGIFFIRNAKYNSARKVPITSDLGTLLQRWLRLRNEKGDISHNKVFVSQRGNEPITVNTIDNLFQTISKHIGIKITAHMLRHTFCHDLIEHGKSIHEIASLAGHESLDTTKLYLTPSEEELRKVNDVLSTGEFD